MKKFAGLFTEIERTTKTNAKIDALVAYFNQASPEDALWSIALIMGKRIKRPVPTAFLKQWATELAALPYWLFEESYHIVGDLAETIALILPPAAGYYDNSLTETIFFLQSLTSYNEQEKKEAILQHWMSMNETERFVFNKLITGNFRMGVSRQLIIKALARYTEEEERKIAHKLMGDWDPGNTTLASLLSDEEGSQKDYLPYPFFLAYPLDLEPEQLGAAEEWQIEPKFDGIRGQIIVRNRSVFVWSRGEELITDKFPEFKELYHTIPDGTVLDGEIIPWKEGALLPFAQLQTRIGRKNLTVRILQQVPIVMFCYDIMEWGGADIRQEPLHYRRALLEELIAIHPAEAPLKLSPVFDCTEWSEVKEIREQSRAANYEGLMLKRKSSIYETGRRRGDWWKWKVEPFTIDCILIYAQQGHGRRANLFTDYTFAVWDKGTLVPFAKAYSGLTDKEIDELDRWIRRNTIEKFGPVRSVHPVQVFELAFEGINASSRHKSGVAVRFPRILRWRKDKKAEEANNKEDLIRLTLMQDHE